MSDDIIALAKKIALQSSRHDFEVLRELIFRAEKAEAERDAAVALGKRLAKIYRPNAPHEEVFVALHDAIAAGWIEGGSDGPTDL